MAPEPEEVVVMYHSASSRRAVTPSSRMTPSSLHMTP